MARKCLEDSNWVLRCWRSCFQLILQDEMIVDEHSTEDFGELRSKIWWRGTMPPHQTACQYCSPADSLGNRLCAYKPVSSRWWICWTDIGCWGSSTSSMVINCVYLIWEVQRTILQSTFMKYCMFSEGIQIWWYIQQNTPWCLPFPSHFQVNWLFLCYYSCVCLWTTTNRIMHFFKMCHLAFLKPCSAQALSAITCCAHMADWDHMLMRKLKFWVCFFLYDINANNIELHVKNIKCTGTATKKLVKCVYFYWSPFMANTDLTLVSFFLFFFL